VSEKQTVATPRLALFQPSAFRISPFALLHNPNGVLHISPVVATLRRLASLPWDNRAENFPNPESGCITPDHPFKQSKRATTHST
jgi:hypothetical protein